jgi:hypothetical protein
MKNNNTKRAFWHGISLANAENTLDSAVGQYKVAQQRLVNCTAWLCHCGTSVQLAKYAADLQVAWGSVDYARNNYETAFNKAVELGFKKRADQRLLDRNECATQR